MPVGGHTPVGTNLLGDRNLTSPTNFHFLFVLFLIHVRKRTKKKRAARRGAGFSVNHLSGAIGIWVPCHRTSPAGTKLLDGFARKNPPHHHRSLDRNLQSTVRRCSCALERLQTPQHPHQPTPYPPSRGEGGNCDPLAVSWFSPPLPPGEGVGGRGLRKFGET